MLRRALELNEKVLGPEHPDTLTSINLAVVLEGQGKYEAAEMMHRRALELREKVLGPKHPDTLGSMNNLAFVLRLQGKYEAAEAMRRPTLVLDSREISQPPRPLP
jgi:Flp pilus assembly protein TadD